MKDKIALLALLTALNSCTCGNDSDNQDASTDAAPDTITEIVEAEPEFDMVFAEEDTVPLQSFAELMGLVASNGHTASPIEKGGYCGLKVALVGDSLTAGDNYNTYLAKICHPVSIIRNEDGNSRTHYRTKGTDLFAAWGRRTKEMRKYLPIIIEAWHPDTVVIIGGTNDLSRHAKGVRNITDDLKYMFNYANKRDIRTVSATILPVLTDEDRRRRWHNPEHRDNIIYNIHALNRWVLSDANPADIKIDLYHTFEDPRGSDNANPKLIRDGLHPGALGQQLMAWKIYEAILR